MVGIEESGVPYFFSAVDVGIKGVPLCVPLEGSSVEDVRQVEIFFARNLRQVSLVFVNGFGQAKVSQVFL